jgi:hypothetical protein
VALTLQSARRILGQPEAGQKLQAAIDELDETIRQIRTTVFAISQPVRRLAGGSQAARFAPRCCTWWSRSPRAALCRSMWSHSSGAPPGRDLASPEERARLLGGRSLLESTDDGGMRLFWQVTRLQ